MVIDFHTHIFPPAIAEKAINVLEDNVEKIQGERWKANLNGTIDDLLRSMEEYKIDLSVVLPIATNIHQSKTINEYAVKMNAIDNIYSLGSLHPLQKDWEETLYDIKEKGLKGIKLHPEYQQFYIDSPESVRILKKCEELDLIVVLHAGGDIGVAPPVHCPPERLRRVLDYDIDGSKVIAGHLGGYTMWDDVEKYLVGTNVILDTAYTARFIKREQFIRIVHDHGSKKIVFGTDSPWEIQGETVDYIKNLPISQEEKEDILHKTAERLLKPGK